MTAGPFFGGLITKIGFNNAIFNGYTGSGWIMAGVWLVFWAYAALYFEDVEERLMSLPVTPKEVQVSAVSDDEEASTPRPSMDLEELEDTERRRITLPQWGVILCMCWCAMTCFFILGNLSLRPRVCHENNTFSPVRCMGVEYSRVQHRTLAVAPFPLWRRKLHCPWRSHNVSFPHCKSGNGAASAGSPHSPYRRIPWTLRASRLHFSRRVKQSQLRQHVRVLVVGCAWFQPS